MSSGAAGTLLERFGTVVLCVSTTAACGFCTASGVSSVDTAGFTAEGTSGALKCCTAMGADGLLSFLTSSSGVIGLLGADGSLLGSCDPEAGCGLAPAQPPHFVFI